MSALQDLIEISKKVAQHPRLVQGGGGNCSVKSGGQRWVKASGCFLEDISDKKGFAIVDAVSGAPIDESGGKASMETPLHTLLGSFVSHTHPVAVAALMSSIESKVWFAQLFLEPQFIWVPYATPGKKLFEKVKSIIKRDDSDKIIFLQNHGLFVSSESKQRALDLHEQTASCVENFFEKVKTRLEIPDGHYLTPDHVIYGQLKNDAASTKQKTAVNETLQLVGEALAMIYQKGGTPHWLLNSEVALLLNMEEEKHRRQVWKNS